MKIKNIRNSYTEKVVKASLIGLCSSFLIYSGFELKNLDSKSTVDSDTSYSIWYEYPEHQIRSWNKEIDERILFNYIDPFEYNGDLIWGSQISKEQYLVNQGVYLIGTSVDIRSDARVASTMYELVDDKPDLKPTYEANSNIGREEYSMVFMNAEGELRASYDNETAYELLTNGYEFVGYCLENMYSTETEKEGFYRKEDVYCTEGQNLSLKR